MNRPVSSRSTHHTPRARGRSQRLAPRPSLERLEDRLAPATQLFNPGDAAGLVNSLQAASNTPGDTTVINLQPGVTYTLTGMNNSWYGPTGVPPIDSNVIIHGNGATIARDTNPPTRRPPSLSSTSPAEWSCPRGH
jgi:hypothetical protein